MNMKKIAILALSLCMIAAIAITGTIAYFTDTDTETNTFTIGNIEIAIEEIFPEDELMPGSKTENNLQKEVYVENTGDNDAYMWIEVLIPSTLDTPENASLNDLHFNYYDTYLDAYGSPVVCSSAYAAEMGYGDPYYVINEVYMGQVADAESGIVYNRYLHYTADDTAKVSGEKTAALLAQVYMDEDITQCTEGHEACVVLKDGTHYAGTWEIIINAFGIQAQGMANIEEAVNTYYDDTIL